MEKQINLDEILKSYLTLEAMRENNSDYTYNMVLSAMKEACRQTLELAVENVGFVETTSETLNSEEYKPFITADDNTMWTINKESILDTIKQVKL